MNVFIPVSSLFSFLIFCVLGDQEFLFITQNSIKKYDITNNNTTVPINDDDTRLSNLNDVDFDFELQIMFYLVGRKQIYSYNLITKEQKLIIKTDQEIPHIVVDWVTKKIYFSVSDRKRIIVCSYDGTIQKILFQRNLSSSLKALCVSPKHGYLFFSDIGYDAKIERANMDGTNAVALVTENISMPVALAIDPVEPIIYWIDVLEQTVEMIHMDGTNRKILMHISNTQWGMISALAVLQSKIFFMENPNANAEKQLNSRIISCTKSNDTLIDCATVLESKQHYASIKAYGKEYQPFMNSACAFKDGPCSHLCLLKPSGYSCACPTGYKVNDDNKTCATSFKKFIIFATKPDIRLISLDVDGRYDMTLPVKSQRIVNTVDYDPIDQMIYWTEETPSEFGVIKRATLNGTVIEEVVSQGYTLPDHLAIDWVARNMYWTCPKFNKIYVSRLDGSSNMVVINDDLEQPRGIAVDPGDGRLYWSDWGTHKQKIESSDLDGSERKVLVDHDLQWPNGIALDYHNRHLYWVDAGTDKIEYYDLNKKTRNRVPKAGSPHAFGISILGEMLYWTDWQKRSLYQFNRETNEVIEIVESVPDIMGIKAVDTTLQYGKNDCGNQNFGCSHFCFHKPNHGAYCACPAGFHLSEDKKNCKVTGYLLFATKTSIHALSLNKLPNTHQSSGSKVLSKDISHIEAFAKTNRVYWVEGSGGGHRAAAIKSVSLNKSQTEDVEYVQTGFSGLLGGITIDWLSENIYWSQSKLHRIEVSKLDGRFKRIIINDTKARITHIAVDPIKRRLYWFEEHNEGASLISSDLSGHDKNTLANVTRNVHGLTVDVNENRVYWMLDNSLRSLTWDGRDEKVVSITLRFPSGMKFFRNNIYICEQENSHSVALTISAVDTTNGKKSVLMFDRSKWCRDITVFHSSLQKGDNICVKNNGGCEQLCFATAMVNRTCQCESHYTLNPADNTSCIPPTSYLLIGQKESAFRFVPSEQTNLALNLKSSTTISMLAFNILTNRLYWLEANLKNTIKYLYNNVAHTLDLQKTDADPQSFTIDFFSNVLYWTDGSDSSISFVHLVYPSKHGVIFKNERFRPIKITSIPEKGLLIFLNDMSLTPTTIESVTMDGNHLKTLHTFKETETKCDIAVDYNNARVYWLHLEDKKIESVNLQGQDRQLLMQFDKENFKPLTIAVYDKLIYWIDKKQKDSQVEYLKWRHIQKELNVIYSSKWEYDGSRDLHVVQTDRLKVDHPCKTNNGGCSHICFYTGKASVNISQCSCPLGYGFLDEKRTQCERRTMPTCTNICNGLCLASDVWCDELVNCQQEEVKNLTCSCKNSSKYMCLDGPCIIGNEKFCDGHQDCDNNIDEDENRCAAQENTTRPSVSFSRPVTDAAEIQPTNYSDYTAGIVSGVILTVLVFTCFLYVIYKLHHKKAALQKEEVKSFLQHTKFKTITESAFILTPISAESAMSGTYISRTLPPSPLHENNFPIRYIGGSLTNMTDSTILPFNPPPTIASGSMTSVNEYPNDDGISEMSVDIPAPPATPLYDPSDVESVLTNDIDNTHGRSCKVTAPDRQHVPTCQHCSRQQSQQKYLYKNYSRRCSESCNSSTLSSNYTQSAKKGRPIYSKNSCCDHDSVCSSHHKTFRSKPSSYHPPSLVSEDSEYSNNTLPRMHHGGTRRLVPSLASVSRCSSETSVITVRQRDDVSKYSSGRGGSYYNNYAPPPSPGLEYTMELNDFKDFKDEEEEAIENNLLIEPHRPRDE